jgi:NADPH:quinone reductase-like Zn-dependent oxidoreductase
MWHEPEKVATWMKVLLDGVSDGWVRPFVDKRFPFAQAGDAHSYLEERKNIGKVVLVP